MRSILTTLCLLLVAGCGAVGLPRPLSSGEASTLRNVASPLVLAIDPAGNDDIAKELVAVLRESHSYKEVGFLSDLGSRADVVGRLKYEHEPVGAVIPLFSIATLGIIPSFFHEHQRISLQLEGLPQGFQVDVQVSARMVMGWVGLLLRVSPKWALVDDPRILPRNNRRLAEHLAAALALRSEEIRSLATRAPRT